MKLTVAARSLAQELSEHIRSAILQSSGVLAQCSSGHTHILILVTLLKKGSYSNKHIMQNVKESKASGIFQTFSFLYNQNTPARQTGEHCIM